MVVWQHVLKDLVPFPIILLFSLDYLVICTLDGRDMAGITWLEVCVCLHPKDTSWTERRWREGAERFIEEETDGEMEGDSRRERAEWERAGLI